MKIITTTLSVCLSIAYLTTTSEACSCLYESDLDKFCREDIGESESFIITGRIKDVYDTKEPTPDVYVEPPPEVVDDKGAIAEIQPILLFENEEPYDKFIKVKVRRSFKGSLERDEIIDVKYGSGPYPNSCEYLNLTPDNIGDAYFMSGSFYNGKFHLSPCGFWRNVENMSKEVKQQWGRWRRKPEEACGKKCVRGCKEFTNGCKTCTCNKDQSFGTCQDDCAELQPWELYGIKTEPTCLCHVRKPPAECTLECDKYKRDENGCATCECRSPCHVKDACPSDAETCEVQNGEALCVFAEF